jgi:hypothetical protein
MQHFCESEDVKQKCGVYTSVAEPHHFYAAPAPATGKNFDAAPAPAPTLLARQNF